MFCIDKSSAGTGRWRDNKLWICLLARNRRLCQETLLCLSQTYVSESISVNMFYCMKTTCAQRQHTSTNANHFATTPSTRIQIWISGTDLVPDPDVCWISGFISLSASDISPSFTKSGWCLYSLRNANISLQWWGKWKSDLESISGTGSSPKVNQFFWLVGLIMTLKFQLNRLITFVILLTDRQTDRQTIRTEYTQVIHSHQWVRHATGLISYLLWV